MNASFEFRILGPFEVSKNGATVDIPPGKPRALLAILLLHAGEVVPVDRLVDELWGERPPATAAKNVQVYVARLRKLLGDELLVTKSPGYTIRIGDAQLDAARFQALVEVARREQPAAAAEHLRLALALWRGPALVDFAYDSFAQDEIRRLEELRLAALEARIDADLALGRHNDVVGELESIVRAHPLRERLQAQLMLALYRCGRQADALASYQLARGRLCEELGLEPSPALQQLEQAILQHDPAVAAPAPSRLDRRGAPAEAGARKRLQSVLVRAMLVAVAVALAAALLLVLRGRSPKRRGLAMIPPGEIGLVDPATNDLVRVISFPGVPGSIAVGLGSVWVGSLTDQTITVVNPQTAAVEHTVSFKTYPSAMAVGAGALWVIEDSVHPDEPAVISRVAPAGDTVTRIAIPRGSAAGALGGHIQNTCGITGTGLQRAKITVGGGRVWFVCVDGTLGSVDPRSNRLNLGTYAIRGTPTGIAADANSVWITDLEHNAVLRVDPATRAILNTLPVAAGPRGIVAGAGSVWVAEFGADVVSRIGAQAPGLPLNERSIPVGRAPSTIVYGDGSIWVANEDGTISRIDPASNIVAATISIGSVPVDIAVGEGGVWITTRS